MSDRWIQESNPKRGALHRQLGIPTGNKIPDSVLERIKDAKLKTTVSVQGHPVRITPLLKKRVNYAINVRWR